MFYLEAMYVFSTKSFGNFFEQFPSFMHGAFGFLSPHTLCSMQFITVAYAFGCNFSSGISAQTIESMLSIDIF